MTCIKTIPEEALATANGDEVIIVISNVRGGKYGAENFYLTRQSGDLLKGSNRDVQGR